MYDTSICSQNHTRVPSVSVPPEDDALKEELDEENVRRLRESFELARQLEGFSGQPEAISLTTSMSKPSTVDEHENISATPDVYGPEDSGQEAAAPSDEDVAQPEEFAPVMQPVSPSDAPLSIEMVVNIFAEYPRQTGLLAILAGYVEQNALLRAAGDSSTNALLSERMGFKPDRATRLLRAGRTAWKYFPTDAWAIIDILLARKTPDKPTLQHLPTLAHLLALHRLSERISEEQLGDVVQQVREQRISAKKIDEMVRAHPAPPKKQRRRAAASTKTMEQRIDEAAELLASIGAEFSAMATPDRESIRPKLVTLTGAAFNFAFVLQ